MCAQLCLTLATPWTVACQAPVSIAFLRQEYWSGVPFPPPGDLPIPRIEPRSLVSPGLAGGLVTTSPTWKAHFYYRLFIVLIICVDTCNFWLHCGLKCWTIYSQMRSLKIWSVQAFKNLWTKLSGKRQFGKMHFGFYFLPLKILEFKLWYVE